MRSTLFGQAKFPVDKYWKDPVQLTISHTLTKKTQKKMKVLSINFLTCAVKACKSTSASFPLHPKDAELAQDEIEINPQFIINVLPRLDWAALKTTSTEVSPTQKIWLWL